jgi:hypothetical protein
MALVLVTQAVTGKLNALLLWQSEDGSAWAERHLVLRIERLLQGQSIDAAFVENSATSGRANGEASNELSSRDFSDERKIHSTPTSSGKHANTVGDRFPQRVRSSWFSGFLRSRAGTSRHTESGCAGCVRNAHASANSHPVSNFCAGQHSAPVRWIGFSKNASPLRPRPPANGAPARHSR